MRLGHTNWCTQTVNTHRQESFMKQLACSDKPALGTLMAHHRLLLVRWKNSLLVCVTSDFNHTAFSLFGL